MMELVKVKKIIIISLKKLDKTEKKSEFLLNGANTIK